jgi:hypothetical protein
MNEPIHFGIRHIAMMFLCIIVFTDCKNLNNQENDANKFLQDTSQLAEESEEAQKFVIAQELLDLETEYVKMLEPIMSLKLTDPKTYWFIVSWLKTSYNTPDWTGYYSEEWKVAAKQNGIDCSGFSRVMLDQIFDKKVSGGSQGLLDNHSIPIGSEYLEMGDLVFFRAPYSKNDKIVHVGVYLQDSYFVHATSAKSAAIGFGLKVNSLNEENWAKEFVIGGKVSRF